jgi:hypothetical protein
MSYYFIALGLGGGQSGLEREAGRGMINIWQHCFWNLHGDVFALLCGDCR